MASDGGAMRPPLRMLTRNEKRLTRRLFLIVWLGIGTTVIASYGRASADGRPSHYLGGQRFNRPNCEKFIFPPIMNPENFPDIMGRTVSESEEKDTKFKSAKEIILGEGTESEYDEKGRKIKKEYKGGFIHQNTRDAIASRRLALKMTRKDLAQRMNLPLRIVAGWEEGTCQPDPVTFNLFQTHLSAILPVPEYPTFYGEKYSWETTSEDGRSDFDGFEGGEEEDENAPQMSRQARAAEGAKTLQEWANRDDEDDDNGKGEEDEKKEANNGANAASGSAVAEELRGLELFDKKQGKT